MSCQLNIREKTDLFLNTAAAQPSARKTGRLPPDSFLKSGYPLNGTKLC